MIDNQKTVAIIPARGGSKGIPRKNIRFLAGRPLIHYILKTALESEFIDRVIVSTDDEEIAYFSELEGVEVCMRPSRLAKDDVRE